MSGGKGGGTTTSTYSPPPEVMANYKYVTDLAKETQKNTPFVPYSGEFVAPLTPTQQAGITNVNQAQGMALPAYAAGLGATAYGARPQTGQFNQGALNQYMSPYLNTVLGGTLAPLQAQQQQELQQFRGSAASRGAFGGDRYGVGLGNILRNQDIATGSTAANVLNQGYAQALGQYNTNISQRQADAARALQAGLNFGQLGTGAQSSVLSGAQAQLAAGAQEQATRQALDQAKYNQFLQEQAYPFQTQSWLANIIEGIGSQSGGTSTTTAPAPSSAAGIFGGLTALASLPWSDERLKENIVKVGKTNDGQPIYKFNYKGDPTTQIGLMAQEVEKKHPEAVYTLGDFKKVDYDAALEGAERGKYYSGGLVHPAHKAGGGISGMIPYVSLENQPGMFPSGLNIPIGKSTIPKAPPVPQTGGLQDIAKGLQAMPSTAKSQMMKNLGLGNTPIDLSKLKAGVGAAGLPDADIMKQFTDNTYQYGTDSGGLSQLFSGLGGVGKASGGRVGYDDGGPVDKSLDDYARAISGIESGGDYGILGPVTKGDRPYGRYQVMGRNIGPWTEAALGQRMTPDEYLANKEAQDAVFKHRFGQYLQQTGNPLDAASMWFSGRPMAQAGNARDVLGTSVPSYVAKFQRNLGNLADMPSAGARDVEGPSAGLNFTRSEPSSDQGIMDRLTDTSRPRSLMERVTGIDLSEQARSGLLAAGLGMMASRSPNFINALGEGGLGGLQTYYNALANQRAAEKQEAELGFKGREVKVAEDRLGIEDFAKKSQLLAILRQQAAGFTNKGMPIPPALQQQMDSLVRSMTGTAPSLAANLPPIGPQKADTGQPAQPSTAPTATPSAQPEQPSTTAQPTTTAQPPAGQAPAQTTVTPAPTAAPVSNVTDPQFLQALDPESNPFELRRRARETAAYDEKASENLMQRAQQIEDKMLERGYGMGRDGKPVSIPGWAEAKIAQENVKANQEYFNKAAESYNARQQTRQQLDSIVNVLENYQSGAFAEEKGKFIAALRAAGVDVPNSATANPAAFEEFMKETMKNVFSEVKTIGGQIRVAEMQGLERASANPTMQPEANKKILAQARGILNMADDQYRDAVDERNKNYYSFDQANFMKNWHADKNHKPSAYEKNAEKEIAVRGATPQNLNDLQVGHRYILEPKQFPNLSKPTKVEFRGIGENGKPRFVPVQ